jgi:hypothetical protein
MNITLQLIFLWTLWKRRIVSINYLLRVVLDFNSVVFMFYFNWMRVTDYFILLIINLLILGATSPKGSEWE